MNLIPPLMALSLKDAFTPGAADFSPMVQPPYSDGLTVSSIVHSAVVEIDEHGTEAAAATAIAIMRSSAFRGFQMVCDHPFHVFLVHSRSGLVLFRGMVKNPDEILQKDS